MYYIPGKNNIEQSNPAGVRKGDGNQLRMVVQWVVFKTREPTLVKPLVIPVVTFLTPRTFAN